jgi:hypothetical protein
MNDGVERVNKILARVASDVKDPRVNSLTSLPLSTPTAFARISIASKIDGIARMFGCGISTHLLMTPLLIHQASMLG